MTTLDARLTRIVEALRQRGPEYAPLVEALTEPCKHLNAAWRDSVPLRAFCPTCHVESVKDEPPYYLPDARVPRSWDGLPDGALVGPVWKGLLQVRRALAKSLGPSEWAKLDELTVSAKEAMWADDTNAAVCDALEAFCGIAAETEAKS